MYHQYIRITNPAAFLELAKQMQCVDIYAPEITSRDFMLTHFQARPIEGYEPPANFPACCSFHQHILNSTGEYIQNFPNCCEAHRRLQKAPWFKKRDYQNFPRKVIDTLSYTEFLIINRIDTLKWYKDITDYIEYCILSFGQLPDGYGAPIALQFYLVGLKDYIRQSKKVPKDKQIKLIQYIDDDRKPARRKEQADLNILIATYNRWLKIFPFEISYLRHLKEYFENQYPILEGPFVENPYTGFVKAKVKTQKALIEFLISNTENILTEINGLSLCEKGLISDAQKLHIEVVNGNRRLELKELKEKPCDERKQYIKILKEWFSGEKKYFLEIGPLLRSAESTVNDSNKVNSNELASNKKSNTMQEIPFEPIDDGDGIFRKVPFEIAIIYKYIFPNAHARYIGIEEGGHTYYTETSTYYCFKEDFKEGSLYTEDLQPLTCENMSPYYKSYCEGFLAGYKMFDEKIKNSTSVFGSDIQSVVIRVFDYINTSVPGFAQYGHERLNGVNMKVMKRESMFDSGIKQGEKYKAWYYIINNYRYFISLFRTHKPFIVYYRQASEYWRNAPGGEGMYSKLVNLLNEIDDNPNKEKDIIEENDTNDYLKSTIEDYFDEIKEAFRGEADYKRAVEILASFFKGKLIQFKQRIFVKKGFKKRLAFVLGEVYRSQRNEPLNFEYLDFSRTLFSIFENENIQDTQINKTNLYKYFTSKT